MAVYTKINSKQIKFIERKYNIGKIENYSGIKKGIENTNFLLKTKKNKYILTKEGKKFADGISSDLFIINQDEILKK